MEVLAYGTALVPPDAAPAARDGPTGPYAAERPRRGRLREPPAPGRHQRLARAPPAHLRDARDRGDRARGGDGRGAAPRRWSRRPAGALRGRAPHRLAHPDRVRRRGGSPRGGRVPERSGRAARRGHAAAEGMAVTVHYDPAGTVNAFATAGGNLVFYRGLLERMPHENALAMVVAHEIAHVLHRDPLAALGGGVASTVALLVLTGNAGSRAASEALEQRGAPDRDELHPAHGARRRRGRGRGARPALRARGRGGGAVRARRRGARRGRVRRGPGGGRVEAAGGCATCSSDSPAPTRSMPTGSRRSTSSPARGASPRREETTPLPPAFGSWLDDDG